MSSSSKWTLDFSAAAMWAPREELRDDDEWSVAVPDEFVPVGLGSRYFVVVGRLNVDRGDW